MLEVVSKRLTWLTFVVAAPLAACGGHSAADTSAVVSNETVDEPSNPRGSTNRANGGASGRAAGSGGSRAIGRSAGAGGAGADEGGDAGVASGEHAGAGAQHAAGSGGPVGGSGRAGTPGGGAGGTAGAPAQGGDGSVAGGSGSAAAGSGGGAAGSGSAAAGSGGAAGGSGVAGASASGGSGGNGEVGGAGAGGSAQAGQGGELAQGGQGGMPSPRPDIDPNALLDSSGLRVSEILGYYDGDWGELALELRGPEIWGSYSRAEGTLVLSVRADGVLEGWWSEAPSRSAPDHAGQIELRAARSGDVIAVTGRRRAGTDGAWRDDLNLLLIAGQNAPSALAERFDDPEAFKRHP